MCAATSRLASALERLAERLDNLPTEPGVYLMRDVRNQVIYVGKAINLRSRVRSYFHQGGDPRAFVQLLDELLETIEVVVVGSEREALLLENALIKQHRPRFNILLRDDKNFLSLRVDLTGIEAAQRGREVPKPRRYPRLSVTRKPRQDGARYFGPFTSSVAVRQTMRLVNRHFGLRTCSDRTFSARRRPCILYQMKRCPGPCTLEVPEDQYRQRLEEVLLLLGGRHHELLDGLRLRMAAQAEALEYEAAAKLRDQIHAIDVVVSARTAPGGRLLDRDLVGYAREGHLLVVALIPVRHNLLGAPVLHRFDDLVVPDAEALSSLLAQHYETVADDELPAELLLPFAVDEAEILADWLGQRRRQAGAGRKGVQLKVPVRGEARQLLELAHRNARMALEDARRSQDQRQAAVAALQRRLQLTLPPRRIECFDVSTTQGSSAVAAKVLFVDGAPDKSGYRRFTIRNVAGQDDFAMLHEALLRRLRRGKQEGGLPDLLLVDGGKGQLAVARAACRDAGVEGLAVAGIAKARLDPSAQRGDDVSQRSDERIFLPDVRDPIVLPTHSAERALVEQVRDEAHRFAITFHRQRRGKRSLASELDAVPGVGKVLRGRLLRQFGSVKALRQASVEELVAVKGVSSRLAEVLHSQLASSPV